MRDYINLALFFGLIGLVAYIGSIDLANTLWLVAGMFIGSAVFIGFSRRGFLNNKKRPTGRPS